MTLTARLARLRKLLDTTGEWAAELEIPQMTSEDVLRAERILRLIHDPDAVSIFPSEEGNPQLQKDSEHGLRLVDVTEARLSGWQHRSGERDTDYEFQTDAEAAAFLEEES